MTRPWLRLIESSDLKRILMERAAEQWGVWLESLREWEWFVTLTLKEDMLDANAMHLRSTGLWLLKKRWREWLVHCKDISPISGVISYVRVFEVQKQRRAYHIHALVSGADCSISDARAWAWNRIGFNKTVQYVRALGAAHYCSKYLVKEFQEFDFSEDIVAELKEKRKEGQS